MADCAELPQIAPGSLPKIGEPDCVRWAGAVKMTQFPAPQLPPLLACSSSSALAAPSLACQMPPGSAKRLPGIGSFQCWLGRVWCGPGSGIKGSHSLPVADLPHDLDRGPVLVASVFQLEMGGARRVIVEQRSQTGTGKAGNKISELLLQVPTVSRTQLKGTPVNRPMPPPSSSSSP